MAKLNRNIRVLEKDCFAYKIGGCTALNVEDCCGCGFYKKKGTECDTCHNKGKESCSKCHSTEREGEIWQ